MADHEQAISGDLNDSEAYKNRGNAWYEKGDYDKAIQHATTVCDLTEWKDDFCIELLADAYAENGNFDEAIKWQTEALSMAPASEKANRQSQLDLFKAGKTFWGCPGK